MPSTLSPLHELGWLLRRPSVLLTLALLAGIATFKGLVFSRIVQAPITERTEIYGGLLVGIEALVFYACQFLLARKLGRNEAPLRPRWVLWIVALILFVLIWRIWTFAFTLAVLDSVSRAALPYVSQAGRFVWSVFSLPFEVWVVALAIGHRGAAMGTVMRRFFSSAAILLGWYALLLFAARIIPILVMAGATVLGNRDAAPAIAAVLAILRLAVELLYPIAAYRVTAAPAEAGVDQVFD